MLKKQLIRICVKELSSGFGWLSQVEVVDEHSISVGRTQWLRASHVRYCMAALDISSVLCTWFAWSNQLIRLASLILNLACSAGDSRYPFKILHLAVSTMKTYLTFARISLKYSFWFHSASRWVLKRKIRQDVDFFVSISDTVEILWKHCDCRSRIHELLIR